MGNKKPAKAQAAVVGAAGPPAAAGTNGPAPAEPGKGGVAGASGARGKVAPAGNNINGARAGSAQPAAAAAAANATARVDGAPAAPAPPLVPTTVTLGQVLQGSWPFMAALVIVPSPMPPSVVADAAASGARPASSQPGPVPAAAAQTGSGPAPPPGPAAAPPAATIGQPQSYSVSLDLNSTLLANPVIRHLFSRVFDRFPDPQPSQKASTLLTAEEILAERPALADTLDNLVEATRTLFVDPGSPSRAKLASDMVEDQLLDIFYDPPPFVPDDFTLLASPAAVPSVTSLFSEGSVPSVHEEHDEENEESDEESYCEDYLDDPPPDPASAEFLSELFFCVALWYLNGSFGREVDYALAVRWMAEGVRRFGIVPPENGEMGWRGDEGWLVWSHALESTGRLTLTSRQRFSRSLTSHITA